MSGSEARGGKVAGIYHPAGSARSIAATLAGAHGSIAIWLEDGEAERAGPGEFTVSDRIAGVPRRIELGGGAVFVTRDDDGLEAAVGEPARGRVSAMIARLERPSLKLVVIGAFTVLAIVAGVRWGVPVAARVAAMLVPQSINAEIGAGTLATVDRLMIGPSRLDAAEQAKVETDFDRLAAAAGLEGKVSLDFRDGGDFGPNAFTMAGGVIVVTDELVRLAEHPGEVAGVLAHELAHAEFRHPEQAIWRAIGFAVAFSVLFGDAGSMAEEMAAAGVVLVQQSHTREHERDADLRAVEVMRVGGFEAGHFVVALDRLHGECGAACSQSTWLSSHPSGAEREAELCRALARPGPAARLCARWADSE